MSQRAKIRSVTPLEEGAFDAEKGLLTLTVIRPGWNKAKTRYYPAEVLKRDHKVFAGAKMFLNHQTRSEERDRPEGDTRAWVSSIKDIWAEADGTVRARAAVIDPAFKAKLTELAKHKLLPEQGTSIRALGEGSEGEREGHTGLVLEKFIAGRSVDFVTYAGAGGQAELLEADSVRDEDDVDLVTLEALRERRPDLVELIESTARGGSNMPKTLEQLEADVRDLSTKLTAAATTNEAALAAEKAKTTAAEKDRDDAKNKLAESEKKERIAATAVKIKEMLDAKDGIAKDLPEAAKKRILERFKDAEKVDGVEDAVKSEKAYLTELKGKGGVRNLGENANGNAEDKAVDLTESFKRMGLSEEAAKAAAARR